MSVNSVDPTKKTTLPFLNVEPPKSEAKKPTLNQDASVNAPKADLAAYVATQLPQKLDGPGVSSGVFGSMSPNVAGMTDGELGKNIGKLTAAMKASPGKVNADDFANLKSMLVAAQVRSNAHLTSTKPPGDLNNRELFGALVAFDVAKASGTKLTKEQEARHAALEGEWKKRSSLDANAEIKFLEKERKHLETKMVVHCTAAFAGATSLATHNGGVGMAGSALVIAHAAEEGHYGEVAFESVLALAARIPILHKGAEATGVAVNSLQCLDAALKYKHAGDEIEKLKAAKK